MSIFHRHFQFLVCKTKFKFTIVYLRILIIHEFTYFTEIIHIVITYWCKKDTQFTESVFNCVSPFDVDKIERITAIISWCFRTFTYQNYFDFPSIILGIICCRDSSNYNSQVPKKANNFASQVSNRSYRNWNKIFNHTVRIPTVSIGGWWAEPCGLRCPTLRPRLRIIVRVVPYYQPIMMIIYSVATDSK